MTKTNEPSKRSKAGTTEQEAIRDLEDSMAPAVPAPPVLSDPQTCLNCGKVKYSHIPDIEGDVLYCDPDDCIGERRMWRYVHPSAEPDEPLPTPPAEGSETEEVTEEDRKLAIEYAEDGKWESFEDSAWDALLQQREQIESLTRQLRAAQSKPVAAEGGLPPLDDGICKHCSGKGCWHCDELAIVDLPPLDVTDEDETEASRRHDFDDDRVPAQYLQLLTILVCRERQLRAALAAQPATDEKLRMLGIKAEYEAAIEYMGGRTTYPGTDWGRTLSDEIQRYADEQKSAAPVLSGEREAPKVVEQGFYLEKVGDLWTTRHVGVSGFQPSNASEISLWDKLLATRELLAMESCVLSMTVLRLGGIVEGRPTGRGNFLQRIDELVEKEAEAAKLSDLLCPVHASIDVRGELTPFDNCIACIRNERDELRTSLASLAKPEGVETV